MLTVCCFLFKGIDSNSASYLLSIIGITNTIGRVVCGYVADFPKVNALLMNNICLVVSTVAVAATPFCSSFAGYIAMSIFFGIAICKYTDNISCLFLNFIIISNFLRTSKQVSSHLMSDWYKSLEKHALLFKVAHPIALLNRTKITIGQHSIIFKKNKAFFCY